MSAYKFRLSLELRLHSSEHVLHDKDMKSLLNNICMFELRLFLFSFCDKVGRSCKVAVRVPFHENISGEFSEKSSVKKESQSMCL